MVREPSPFNAGKDIFGGLFSVVGSLCILVHVYCIMGPSLYLLLFFIFICILIDCCS